MDLPGLTALVRLALPQTKGLLTPSPREHCFLCRRLTGHDFFATVLPILVCSVFFTEPDSSRKLPLLDPSLLWEATQCRGRIMTFGIS